MNTDIVGTHRNQYLESDAFNVIFATFVTDGTSGPDWIDRLERNGITLSESAKSILNSPDFIPSSGRIVDIGILRVSPHIVSEHETENICAKAEKMKWTRLNAEAACLILEKFSPDEFKRQRLESVVAFHKPIKTAENRPSFLTATIFDACKMLLACPDKKNGYWNFGTGIAFEICH